MSRDNDFELIAITRDLARKPEVKFLAITMQKILNPAASRETEHLEPSLVKLAHHLVNNPQKREMFMSALGMVI